MEKITSRSNDKIKLAAALRSNARVRREHGLFFLEGARLCCDAAQCGVKFREVYFTAETLEKYADKNKVIAAAADSVYLIDAALCDKLSDTKTPQGVFCVCKMLDKTESCNKIDEKGKYIALDNIQSPDNLGAVSRTAEAFGLSGLIVGEGCDIYNPKALRASMGALLRLPIIETDNLPAMIAGLSRIGMKTAAAVPDVGAQSVSDISFEGGAVCVVGNEGSGISDGVLNACELTVTIPMKGRAESLNAAAAAAVLIWEMTRER